ncbi:MAG: hypothetical protein J1F67_11140 [Muribaculaceae bacterium]|nr:hypothetical protein [Muribaculaceae bacterium]
MTQITATISNEADPDLIRQIFENIKGVIETSISFKGDKNAEENDPIDPAVLTQEKKEWLNKLNRLYNNVDREAIDVNDEKTRYILSK